VAVYAALSAFQLVHCLTPIPKWGVGGGETADYHTQNVLTEELPKMILVIRFSTLELNVLLWLSDTSCVKRVEKPKYLRWPIPLKPEPHINKQSKTSMRVHHTADVQQDGRNTVCSVGSTTIWRIWFSSYVKNRL
jgi:hypothetical protein